MLQTSYGHYECFRGDASPADDINSGTPAEHNGLTEYGKVSYQFISVQYITNVLLWMTVKCGLLFWGKKINYKCLKQNVYENTWF
jgi:hypothetical protein